MMLDITAGFSMFSRWRGIHVGVIITAAISVMAEIITGFVNWFFLCAVLARVVSLCRSSFVL